MASAIIGSPIGSIGTDASASGISEAISGSYTEEFGGQAKARNHSGNIAAVYMHKAIGTVTVNGYTNAISCPALGGSCSAGGKDGTVTNASFTASNQDFAKATVTGKYIP